MEIARFPELAAWLVIAAAALAHGSDAWATAPSPYVNVKDFGAKGDGSANDAGAFAAAISALGRGGGTILVPCGTYGLESPLTVSQAGVVIRGLGYCTILRVNHV